MDIATGSASRTNTTRIISSLMSELSKFDCSQLVGRLREICEHRSGLSRSVEDQYIAMWRGHPPVATKPDLACIHRGCHIDWIPCPNCPTGKVKLKIFNCDLHNRCVMGDRIG